MSEPVRDPSAAEREERLRAIVPLLRRVEGEVELMLYGGSMEPTIRDGSLIRIRCQAPADCEVGDIVVMLAGHRVVAHRVVYRGPRGRAARVVITRGDARWLPDPPLSVTALVGVVTRIAKGDQWVPPAPAPEAPSRLASLSLGVLRTMVEFNVTLGRAAAGGLARLRRGYLWLRRVAGPKGGGGSGGPAG